MLANQERISELESLIEYWRLEVSLAKTETRSIIAEKQLAAFREEIKVLLQD
jgi:hypothetical protein